MRSVLFACAVACLLAAAAPRVHAAPALAMTSALSSAPAVVALQVPDKKIEVTVGEHGGGVWYRSPVWIAIGVLAFIVLILLIVMLSRSGGGGTTIVRD